MFTQLEEDEQGRPVRDWESTTYVSSLDPIDESGPRLRREVLRRSLVTAGKVVLLIDGTVGLEHMGDSCLSGCVQIVDFYHALALAA